MRTERNNNVALVWREPRHVEEIKGTDRSLKERLDIAKVKLQCFEYEILCTAMDMVFKALHWIDKKLGFEIGVDL